MNTQVRNEIPRTKKQISSRQNSARNKQNIKIKPVITYDYDAVISQPDVPNFFGQKYNTGVPIRKKGCYTRGKSKLSSKKTSETESETTSNSKYQDKENETVVTLADEETAENETTPIEDESTPIFSKKYFARNDVQKKNAQKSDCEDKDKSENEKNFYNVTPRSLTLKDSKIPRAKSTKSPAIIQISRNESVQRLSVKTSKKSLDTISHAKDMKCVLKKEQNSFTFLNDEQDGNDETIITETTPAVIGSASDPSTFTVLQRLKRSQNYRPCNNYNPELSSYRDIDDTLSDSKSSPERKYISKKKWRSLKHRKYIDTSSDDFDVSSDYSSQSSEKKIKNRRNVPNSVAPLAKSSLTTKSLSRVQNRRGNTFSFFNALFDIVFWPFLFLKSDR
ncbi:PREDICTED: uncharacterized protein LOC107066971 [Polistes dominula]|uniref:Uncharacterized protein LOC107066971 n=1 Tax=Polistes dominula TaxID=743375 RepID=A0ABM1IBE3_POLDO|nr:PREDICTED: uncharacterized protein LOC107066971 [Polistes dominula]XP_015177530.1 PREDICTED: uncharacterized protein LOC107066971 [Polistes dominula]